MSPTGNDGMLELWNNGQSRILQRLSHDPY